MRRQLVVNEIESAIPESVGEQAVER
jgi:hypothetical protein